MSHGDAPPAAVVVTGAAMGIGKEVVRQLAAAGSVVVAVDRNRPALHDTAAELRGVVVTVVGDISAWDTHERAADAAQARGVLRGWVNNAGVDLMAAAHEVSGDHIEQGLRVLQLGPMFGTAVATRRMLSTGGSIVNVSSIQGAVAYPAYYTYQAAKAAVTMMSKGTAVDYAAFGIRCNVVLPGGIDTPMTRQGLTDGQVEELLRSAGAETPAGRIGAAAEVAATVTYLLSDRASYVTGAEIVVDGGATARASAS